MDGLSHLGTALAALAGPWQIGYALGATLAGIVIGLLPGLSATLGVALFTTLTVKMAPTDAILVLVCVYVGAIYGGSRTAILLNIPGTAANAAACLDGNMLARQGQAGRAMGIATTGSVAGLAVRRHLPRDVHAAAGRDGAEVRRLRVLLARHGRRDDVGQRSPAPTR